MFTKKMKQFSAAVLSALMLITSIPTSVLADPVQDTTVETTSEQTGAEQDGSFVFAAFTQNETVVEPVSISYEAGDTVKDALADSEIAFKGLENGYIQSVADVDGNYSMVYADGGYGLDTAADQVGTMFLSERTDVVRKDEDKDKDDPDDLVVAVSSALTVMAGYNESENNIQNYKPAQTAYSTLLNIMRTADKDTMKTKTADLQAKIAEYDSYLSGNKRTVTVHVTQGENEVTDAKLAFTDEYGNVTEATGNQIQLLDGKYSFVITDSHHPYNYTTNVGKMNSSAGGSWKIVENYFTVSESSTEVSVKLASGEWFGTITAAGSKDNVLDTSKTEYDTENHKIVFYVADSYSHRVDTVTAKADGTPVKTKEGTLSSVDIYPWIDFVYGSGNNAGKKVSDVAQTSNTNKASFGGNRINNNVLDLGMTGNTLTAEIRWLDDTEEDATGYMVVQSYELEVKRIPTLTELVVKDRAGTSVLTGYNTYVYNYDVTTTDSSFTVETAAYGENYTVALKAGENTTVDGDQVTLNGEKGQFTVEVASGDATNTYTVNLTKVEAVDVTLNLPENVTAEVLNGNGSKIEPKEAGGSVYALVPSEVYTYNAVKEEQYHTTASFTAAADLTVQVAEPEVKEVLTNFALYDAMSKNTRKPYVWNQPFTSSVHNYTVQVSDVNTAVFAQADKSDTKYDYYVRYVQQHTGTTYGDVLKDWTKQNINFAVGETTTNAQNIMRLVAASGKSNLFQLRVQKTVSEVTYYQEYDFNLVRTLHLKEMSVSSASAGELQLLDEEGKAISFDRDIFSYNAKIAADTTSLSMTMTFPNESSTYSFDGGYSVEVNGQPAEDVKNVTIPLDVNEEVETVTIKVLHKDTKAISNTYTIKIKKQTPIAVTFNTNPKNATVFITNTLDNKNIYADENGIFTMMPGVPYNYIVTATGYKALEVSDYTLEETPAEVTVDINLEQAPAAETALPDYEAQWPTFRADFNGNGVVSAKTPITSDDAVLYWAEKLGEGFDSDASGCPILVDGYLYTYAGDRILKVDTISGKVVKNGQMATKSSFAINSPTYADGMIFVGLGGGKVQAFNAETLESLWLYTDPLGGQPNCSIKYHKGHIYTGFWNSETKKANFVCISVTDEDPTQTTEAKQASWRYTHNGFYWAGAYACDDYVLVGTDDGESGYTTGHASVLSFNPTTGKLIDEKVLPGVGDLRSDIMYDKEGTGDFYFTTKGGDFYGLSVNADGTFKNLKQLKLYNYSGDSSNPPMSTCTPVVYNGRAYIGVSGVGQFSAYSGHNITVIDLECWSIAYTVRTQGYPQTSGLLTTAYEEDTGLVYVYFIDNYTPGKLRVIADKNGQTEPLEVTQENGYDVAPVLFTPYGSQAQYAICSPISDENGFLYFKNDSAHMMCVGPALEKIEVTKQPDKTTYKVGETFEADGMEVIATYSNGATKDITDYVTYSTDKLTEDDTELIIEFPYAMYQNKDGEVGVEYTAPTARVALTIDDGQPRADVKIQGMHDAQVKSAKLYAYADKETKNKDLLEGLETTYDSATYSNYYEVRLKLGDYWLEGYDANGDLNGGIKLTVTADTTGFYVQRIYSIYCTNSGWVEGTDYETSVAVTNGTDTREITLGKATYLGSTRTSCLFLKGDNVAATFTPIGERADSYLENTITKSAVSMNSSISGKVFETVTMTFTVPKGSTVDLGKTLQNNYYTQEFCTGTVTSGSDDTDIWIYRISKESTNKVNGPYYFYRVENEQGVTYWDFFAPTELNDETKNITLTEEDLFIGSEDFTKDTIIKDYSENKHDTANIYMNINAQGYKNMAVGDTYELNMFRNWQAIEHFYNRMIALPDMNYEIMEIEGTDVISITPNEKNSSIATMTAEHEGTAIVLVTYDAMYSAKAMTDYDSSAFYKGSKLSATWPEFTGVFVVTVGKDGTSIETGMKIERQGTEGILDAEHDILYYFGEDGASYSFKPESGATVTVNRGKVTETAMTYEKTFTDSGVTTAEDGTVTITGLTTGRHIVKVEKDGVAAYQVITARQASYELQDAEGNVLTADSQIKANDTIYVQFKGLVNPCEKMAGVYNHAAFIQYLGEDGTKQTSTPGGVYGVYDFSSDASEQRVKVTIPKYWTGTTYTLESGVINMRTSGSAPAAHRAVSYISGLKANMDAVQGIGTFLCQIPDIEISLTETEFLSGTLSFQDKDGNGISRDQITITLKDAEDNEVTLNDDSHFQCMPGEYFYTIKAAGYFYATGSVTITNEDLSHTIVLQPSSENAWDGMTLTEPSQTEGIYQIGTGAELAWFADRVNTETTAISAVLTADIDLAGYEWTPIGTATNKCMSGIFDGQGHTVSHLYINASSGYLGLFGCTSGTIKNLTVEGEITTTGNNAVGGTTAYASGGKLENCINKVTIDAAGGNIGGIVGNMSGTTLTSCENRGTVTGKGSNTAGIAGYVGSGTIQKCYNDGAITSIGSYTGGIVGNGNAFTLTESYNTSSVKGTTYVGGVVGRMSGSTWTGYGTITACYNIGRVEGTNYVGGLTSQIGFVNMKDCYNSGTVTGTSNVGGAIASKTYANADVTGTHIYYLDSVTEAENPLSDLCQALTSSELKQADLDQEYYGLTADYPALLWQTDVTFVEKTVTVYMTVMKDSEFMAPNGTVMELKEMQVPYFDLKEYGLQSLYYNPDCYDEESKTQTAGTAQTAKGHITVLHAMIYATEVYYYGIAEEDAGKGYLKTDIWDANAEDNAFVVGGNAGSAGISDFWGFGFSLNYYLNYEMPVAYVGWGSTCDQIELSDQDVISIRYNPFTGSNDGTFYHFGASGDLAYNAEKGEQVSVTLYETTENWTTSETSHNPAGEGYAIYASTSPSADPKTGKKLGETNADGTITIDTARLKTGTYYLTSDSHDPAVAMLVITGDDSADQAAVAAVTAQINAIGEVTLESEAAIQAARTAYDALTECQQDYVTAETLKVLTDAEAKLAELKEEASKPVNPFTDVKDDAYYYDAVLWAVEKGITSGTTPTTFSPKEDCTRAQVVMFLWRAAGEPKVELEANPFSDVGTGSRFYPAIAWAYANGITTGYTDGTFRPNDPVRRAEYITFQWRAAGKPAVTLTENPFADVTRETFPHFYDAIMWAAENEITLGKDGNFLPNDNCARCNVVTFLYRSAIQKDEK